MADCSGAIAQGDQAVLSNTHFAMAVHVLSALAFNEGKLVGSADLARSIGTNPSFLRGLLGQLREGGLIETRLGTGGGSALARSPEQISLLDVYRVTEVKPALTSHTCDGGSPCVVARNMEQILHDLNTRLEATVGQELAKTTLADLVARYIR